MGSLGSMKSIQQHIMPAFPRSSAQFISEERYRLSQNGRTCSIQPHHTTNAHISDDSISRRHHLAALLSSPTLLPSLPSIASPLPSTTTKKQIKPLSLPNYALPGPCRPIKLPQLEHTCSTCENAPADRARLKIYAWVPKGGARFGLDPPYPLAVITPGFLLPASQYESYAERLASWGYCTILYDRTQQPLDPMSDITCVSFLRDLLDWCRSSSLLGTLCDVDRTYLIGHSRGGKISVLTAVEDPRVKAVFLLDPVDVTVYAPVSTDYPSAVEKLKNSGKFGRYLPIAVVGSGRGGDCVPKESNYELFFSATAAPAWEAVIQDAGHLQFLDSRGGNAMDLVCAAGKVSDGAVGELSRAMMVAWGETMLHRQQHQETLGDSAAAIANKGTLSTNEYAKTRPSTIKQEERIQMGLGENGEIVAGVASFDALKALYITEENARREVASRFGVVGMNTRAKNFELLPM